MKLQYRTVSPCDLSPRERLIVYATGEAFSFFLDHGVLVINRELPHLKTLLRCAREMWALDRPLDGAELRAAGLIYDSVSKLAGVSAARRFNIAWSYALRAKLDAEEAEAAGAWLSARSITAELDALGPLYSPGFLRALWRLSDGPDALFLYGYITGRDAATAAATA